MLGITTFFRRHRQDPFDQDDLGLAEEFVGRAALCLDNARRYTRSATRPSYCSAICCRTGSPSRTRWRSPPATGRPTS
jgi:hypothetical protein